MGIRPLQFMFISSIVIRQARSWTPSHRIRSRNQRTSCGRYFSLAAHHLISVEECIHLSKSSPSSSSSSSSSEASVKFVDGTWFHKGDRVGRDEFEQGPRIANSVYFDLIDIACQTEIYPDLNSKNLSAMLPPPSLFAAAMDAFGIRNSDHVVVYGREGCNFLPRIWFTFCELGHVDGGGRVSIMNGSLEEWIEQGGTVETEPVQTLVQANQLDLSKPSSYQTTAIQNKKSNVATLEDMVEALVVRASEEDVVILDARGSSFKKRGHMPGAINIPYASLVEPGSSIKLKSRDRLQQLFLTAGVDPRTTKRIICSCGTGVSACSLFLALEECGRVEDTYMYDGSWQEWSRQSNVPKVLPTLS